MATVIDLYSRRLLGAATGLHPDADLACAAIKMAVAACGGRDAIWREEEIERVIFHTDRASTYTANSFTKLAALRGSASPWAESAHASTTPPPRRSSHRCNGRFHRDTSSRPSTTPRSSCWTGATGSTTLTAFLRHSTIGMMSPINYKNTAATHDREAA